MEQQLSLLLDFRCFVCLVLVRFKDLDLLLVIELHLDQDELAFSRDFYHPERGKRGTP